MSAFQTLDSRHLTGHSVDLAGQVSMSQYVRFPPLARRRACLLLLAAVALLAAGGTLPAQPAGGGGQVASPPVTAAPAANGAVAAGAGEEGSARFRTVHEVVLFANGRPAAGATVVARPAGAAAADAGAPVPRVAITDALGRFTLDSLSAGSWTVSVAHPSVRRGVERRLEIGGTAPTTAALTLPEAQPHVLWTVLFLVIYGATILAARWHHIARSIHVMLLSHLTALSTRLANEVDASDDRIKPLRDKVEDLRKRFDPYRWGRVSRIGEFLFWSRGNENAGWVAIHEIERQLAAFLAPPEHVESYLTWAEAQLRVVGSAPALALAESIRVALQPPAAGDRRPAASRENGRKALLGRAISVIYTERDTKFATLMEWHNKASWLILAALVIIGFLAAAAGNAVLFLAGAAGGFLSRVMRALKREDVPLDYGASWTTLFLSPLFGALAGWFGIAIIALVTSDQVALLGAAFAIIDWLDPLSPYALAVAFMLGFSERFFDAVVGAVERHAAGAEAAEQAALVAPGRGTPAAVPVPVPGPLPELTVLRERAAGEDGRFAPGDALEDEPADPPAPVAGEAEDETSHALVPAGPMGQNDSIDGRETESERG